MRFEAYTTCPGCGYEIRMGDCEGSIFLGVSDDSTMVKTEVGTRKIKPYREFNVYEVICSNCGLIFYVSSMVSVRQENIER